MKGALAAIVGQPRTIPFYAVSQGTGNGLNYTIVGFADIRILDVKLTESDTYVCVQPAYVVDPTAVSEDWSDESYFVMQPLRLVR